MTAAPPVRRASAASLIHGGGVAGFLARRIAGGIVTLLVLSVVVFLAVNVLPGSLASAILGKGASTDAVAALEHQLGLDQSLISQYSDWLSGALQGDLGRSAAGLAQGAPNPEVSAIISDPFRNTLILAGIVMILLIPLSLLMGTFLARHAGRWPDLTAGTFILILTAAPEFVLGTLLLLVFFLWLDWLPPTSLVTGSSPLSTPDILVLPVLTLLLTNLAWATRMVRASMTDQLATDWVQTARLNGFKEGFVVWRYGLRNALAPSVQVFTLTAQYLFGGVVVVETVFSYPGIGLTFVNAVNVRDATTVQAIAVIIGAIYIAMNILADFLVTMLVPKLRTSA